MNVSKCSSLTTTNKQNKTRCAYEINGEILTSLTEKTDLGVTFDGKFSFKQHVDATIRKAYRMLGFIFRSAREFGRPNSLIVLYNAYVRSRLEYCSPVWNPIYNVYSDNIERMQRKFTRMLYYKLKHLNMQSLETRRKQADEFLLHKLIHGKVDSNIRSTLNFSSSSRNTQRMFYLPFHKTNNVERNSPIYRMQRNHDEYYSSVNLFKPDSKRFMRREKDLYEY